MATPSLSSVSPTSYPSDSNNHSMQLFGSSFVSGDTLTFTDPQGNIFQSNSAKLTFVNSGEIDYQFNDGTDPGTWTVKVNSADGTLHSGLVSFSVAAAVTPSLSSVSPGLYPADSNNHPMRLFGSNFQSGDTLTFTDPQGHAIPSTASKLTFVSANEIDYQINDGTDPGTWNVEVNSADGTTHSGSLSFTAASQGTFSISASPNPVNESAGSTTLTITRSDTSQAQTVYVSTVNGVNGYSANNGDYATNVDNLPVTFAATEGTKTVTLGINDLGLTSGSKTFGLLVQGSPTNSLTDDVLASGSFTIADNDASAPDTIAENIFTQGALAVGASTTGRIDPIDVSGVTPDKDWYKVSLTGGHQYTVSANVLSGTLGTVAIDLRNTNGNLVPGTLTDATSPSFTYAPQTSGTFFIAVSAGGNDLPTQQGNYGLSLVDNGSAPPPTNASPVIGGNLTFSVAATQTLRFSSLKQNTTDSGGTVVTYQFTDLSGSGFLTLDDVRQSGTVSVSAAQLARVGFLSSVAGSNTIAVQATDDHGHSGSANLSINVTQPQTGLPLLAIASDLMVDVYNSSSSNPDGYIRGTSEDDTDGLFAAPYANPNTPNQIIIAFRGTEQFKNYIADASWVNGSSNNTLSQYLKDALLFVATTKANNPKAQIVLTGHSLGGAIAQLIGLASGLTTIAFDAPGAQQYYANFVDDAQNFQNLMTLSSLIGPAPSGSNTNYRMQGDQVSLVGGHIGDQVTLPSIYDPLTLLDLDISTALASHDQNVLRDQIAAYVNGTIQPTNAGPDVSSFLKNMILGALLSFPVLNDVISVVDPPAGSKFRFLEQSGSPNISSFSLPILSGVQTYQVSYETGSSWSSFQSILPGTWSSVPAGTVGLEFVPLDSSGNPVRVDNSFYVELTFGQSGTVTATMTALSPRNDFNADGASDMLWQSDDGLPVIWEMNGTSMIAGAVLPNSGPSWHVVATGDFNADGKADMVWQADDGLPVIWEMNGTSIIGAAVLPNSGPSWHVIATGDFNGDGKADILWQANDGLPVIWEMNGTSIIGAATLPNSGPSWRVIATGDFNGDGKSDIIWQSIDGLPFIWEMDGTTLIGAGALPNSGPAWHVIGTGDFNGDGKSDILWQSTDGLPVIWEMNGTSLVTGAVLPNSGPSWHAIGTSDFNGDGKADIIWQNTDGLPFIWEMNGASIIGAGALPNSGPTWHIKDDGPIPADQMGIVSAQVSSSAPAPTLQPSAPDAALAAASAPSLPVAFAPPALNDSAGFGSGPASALRIWFDTVVM